jgi:hypothetical protein
MRSSTSAPSSPVDQRRSAAARVREKAVDEVIELLEAIDEITAIDPDELSDAELAELLIGVAEIQRMLRGVIVEWAFARELDVQGVSVDQR